NGSYAVTVDLVDADGTHTNRANPFSVAVSNVAPVLSINGNSSVNEGTSFGLTLGGVVDPGNDSVVQYVIHWGDGTSSTFSSANYPANGAAQHTFADNGAYAVSVDLVNEDGSFLNRSNAFSVLVNNVAPNTLALQGPASGQRGQNLSYSVNFAD